VESKRSPDFKIDIDLRREAHHALRGLLDRVSLLTLTLGTLALAASIFRSTVFGWNMNILLDIILFGALLFIVVIRKRIPIVFVVSSFIIALAVLSTGNFLTLGLATTGFVMFTVCCVFSSVVFGLRAGILLLIGSVIAVALIGIASYYGIIPRKTITEGYLLSPLTWITQMSSYTVFTAGILVIIASVQDRLALSLQKSTRQAEEIKERERMYRLLAENMSDVLFVQNMDMALTYVSPSTEKLFGYALEETLTLKMEDYLTPQSIRKVLESFHAAVSAAEKGGASDIPPLELEYIRKDGTTFWGEMKPVFLRSEDGRLTGILGVLRDISERKAAEKERETLERQLRLSEKLQAIGQLAGGIAHDFNNQLVGIIGFADLLAKNFPQNQEVSSCAENILVAGRRAADLTGKLLSFARKGSFKRAPVNMHAIIGEVIAILSHSIDKRISIVQRFEAPNPTVIGDATQLQNALLNLALNARDAMPNGGELTFYTREAVEQAPAENRLHIVVSDTGVGIEESILGNIFDPFFTTKRKGHNIGMGLAAVYGTVKSHDGMISVKSQPGKGSEFTLSFPLTSETAEIAAETVSPRSIPEGRRVLVIDDENIVRKALCMMLESLGYTVETFGSGREAIAWYRDSYRNIDLVLLDLILPEMDGKAVFEALRGINRDAKILLVSGYSINREVQTIIDKGAAGFIKKPFDIKELSRKIAEVSEV